MLFIWSLIKLVIQLQKSAAKNIQRYFPVNWVAFLARKQNCIDPQAPPKFCKPRTGPKVWLKKNLSLEGLRHYHSSNFFKVGCTNCTSFETCKLYGTKFGHG